MITQFYRPEQWLERLSKQRILVSCHLLARQIPLEKDAIVTSHPEKRVLSEILPELKGDGSSVAIYNEHNRRIEVAICRLTYRAVPWQMFPTDVAEALVRDGNVSVSTSLFASSAEGDDISGRIRVMDTSQRLQDLRKDVQYLDRLSKAEFEAAKQSAGMWNAPEVRERKREVVEEVEFQAKASIFQKIWRWLRGG